MAEGEATVGMTSRRVRVETTNGEEASVETTNGHFASVGMTEAKLKPDYQ